MLRLNTLFKHVCYHPLEHQIVTTGTDHKITFWETFDGSMIRELEGALSGSVNCIEVSPDGVYFVSGGSDKIVKVRLLFSVVSKRRHSFHIDVAVAFQIFCRVHCSKNCMSGIIFIANIFKFRFFNDAACYASQVNCCEIR
jgi:WD40 repeat protein